MQPAHRTSRALLTSQMVTEIRQGFENWELHYLLAKVGVAEVGLEKDTKGVKDAEIHVMQMDSWNWNCTDLKVTRDEGLSST